MNSRAKSIFFFLLFLYLIRLFLIGFLQLIPDEAHYWYWSKNLALSYFDHPPMVAYLMAFFTWIGGDSQFFVRLGGVLITVIAHVFLYLTIKKLSRNTTLSWELLLVLNITLLFSAGCIVQTPDTPLLLFWTLALYSATQIIVGGAATWWYLFGVALGLGLLSKYTMILVVPCQFAFLLFSREHRHWLKRKEPYLAMLLGLIIFSPVIVWNWQHGWVSFAFQLNQGFSPEEGSSVFKLLEYVGGQLGVITPLLFLAFVYYTAWGFYHAGRQGISEYLYLALMSWPILIFFGLSTLRGEVAEANWPAPAYIAGIVLMLMVFRQHFSERSGHRKFVYIGVGLALVLNLLIYVHLFIPTIPISPRYDPTKQFHGWRELGTKINSYIQQYPWQEGYFLVAERITIVAEAVFYTGNKYIGLDFFTPEEYTFLRNVDQLKGKNAIILIHDLEDARIKRYEPYFEEVVVLGKNTSKFRGETINKPSLHILLGKQHRGNWRPAIKNPGL
jgi:undecaprenyl-diphosphatase